MKYVKNVVEFAREKYAGEPEFIQAIEEVFNSLAEVIESNEEHYKKHAILERLITPDRLINFRVAWRDDKGNVQVNNGYRVQFNSALGPYKGGIRFHPSVNASVVKFLGFEQIFKNSLTGLAIGGGKGGSDFNPKGRSDNEIMSFCQSFMNELYKYISADVDVPAGDIGVGKREIGYMYGQYKRLTNLYEGVFTGKDLLYGGSLVRTEATGYGLLYLTQEFMRANGQSIAGKKISFSGSGNVAIYGIEKAIELGAIPITASDSDGWIHDEDGIDLDLLKKIKLENRARISEYIKSKPSAKYTKGRFGWNVKAYIAMPCATQNEINLEEAKELIKHGITIVSEGANMPSTADAMHYLQQHAKMFIPSKAANSGGVSVSLLEMSQNATRLNWSFEEVDEKLKEIMSSMASRIIQASDEFGKTGDYVFAANYLGFKRVVDAILAQGVV